MRNSAGGPGREKREGDEGAGEGEEDGDLTNYQ